MLRPQDVLLVLKLLAMQKASSQNDRSEPAKSLDVVAESNALYDIDRRVGRASKHSQWTYHSLGESVGMSASQTFESMKRAIESGLVRSDGSLRTKPVYDTILAVRYFFPARQGGLVIGIPTAYAGPPLDKVIRPSSDPVPVWAHPSGEIRGLSLEPIYKSAPDAALKDSDLYELLVLLDALRTGRAREVTFARNEFGRLLGFGA